MALSIDWSTLVILVPQADLLFVSTDPTTGRNIYQHDTDAFRLELKSIEASEEGMPYPITHQHNAPVTVGGVTLARVIEIINGYSVEYENGTYAVNLVGSNNNIADKAVVNQVQIRSANSAGLTFSDTINAQSFSRDAVHIDTVNGLPGTSFPRGTPTDPVNNIADALIIAQKWNLRAYSIFGTITLDQNYNKWLFFGSVSKTTGEVLINGYNIDDCSFQFCELGGTGTGKIAAHHVELNNITGLTGEFSSCGINNAVLPANTGTTTFKDCYSEIPGTSMPYIDLGVGVVSSVQVREYYGGIEIRNLDQVTENISIDAPSAHIRLASSCTNGTVVIRGLGKLTDNSAGCTIDRDGFQRAKLTEDQTILSAGRSIP